MDRYEFTFMLDHALSDDETDTLYEAGGDDTTPEINQRANSSLLHFDREAPSLGEALVSALHTVEAAGLRAVAVDSDDLVTLKDVAARTGRTYEGVRLLAAGQRGPGGFPPPMTTSGYALYSWAQVAAWFEATFEEGAPAMPSHYDRVIAAADHLVRARALLAGETKSLVGLVST
jgi:hypothetical protein